jgi:alpha/beta superfamily hydrolase
MKILQKICFVLLLTTFSSVYGGDCFDEVSDIDDCREKAESGLFTKGDREAQFNLGNMYYNGQGVLQDYKEAVKWYRKSAEQRYKGGQYNLGFMYEKGRGVVQDYKEAVKWYTKSAEQGLVQAQFNLGNMYRKGQGVLQDYKEAVKWYRKSAEQGYAYAQNNLGVMYEDGKGVAQSLQEALKWFKKVAEQGNALEQEKFIEAKEQVKVVEAKIAREVQEGVNNSVAFRSRFINPGYPEPPHPLRLGFWDEKEKIQVQPELNASSYIFDFLSISLGFWILLFLFGGFLFYAVKSKKSREEERQKREQQEQSRKKREKPKSRDEESRSYEEILGLSSGWTKSDLKSAYKRKCHQTHPDKWKDFPEDISRRLEKEFKEVQEAYNYLSKK